MLVNMKEILEIAEAEGYAIPCINTPNEETVSCSHWSSRGIKYADHY